jgi:catechol 2,3-dioxygenase-like lactoylglutathione lyase family enzyme
MDDMPAKLSNDCDRGTTSRRELLRALGVAAAGAPFAASAFGQGRCRDGYGTRGCPLTEEVATAPIKPVFAPTGWKTVALDHITFQMADYRKEAAFYIALMGWKLRGDDGKQAVLDISDWGSAIFKEAPEQQRAIVENFGFVIEPWNARTVEAELRKRGLTPVVENDGKGFESFHVKDPDGWDLQIGNGNGLAKARKTAPTAKPSAPAPFEPTGWKTVWLDHLSFGVTNYKESVSFYSNLLGWKETYDEGSQHELMIGEIGDALIRGGNPNDPSFGRGGVAPARRARIDHISFGISPWDTDGVKADLEKRGLRAQIDTSTRDDIHVAAFKSYHTATPNGYNLQISYVTHDNRLVLANAVKPKPAGGR